jgi:hypothetical protein
MFTHCPVALPPMVFASPSESPICGDGSLLAQFRLCPILFVTTSLGSVALMFGVGAETLAG